MSPTDEITLVVDVKNRRPGCVLLQSAYGCGRFNGFLSRTFDTEDWLLAPSKDFRRVTGTRQQWETHAANLRKQRKR